MAESAKIKLGSIVTAERKHKWQPHRPRAPLCTTLPTLMSTEEEWDDEPAVASIRPVYREVFRNITLSDAVTLSSEGTQQLKIGRDGFTYGETALGSVWRVMNRCDLAAYRCRCAEPQLAPSRQRHDAAGLAYLHERGGTTIWEFEGDDGEARCTLCTKRPAGASIIDLGSGIGNVVIGIALIAASGALGADVHVAAVHGVELLPTLHDVAVDATRGLRQWAATAAQKKAPTSAAVAGAAAAAAAPATSSAPPPSQPLPRVSVQRANLEGYDLSDVDVVYMASTVFEDDVIERFAARAAATLRVGSRVVTLASPLRHVAFRVEAVVPCINSWGEEDAYVNVVIEPGT